PILRGQIYLTSPKLLLVSAIAVAPVGSAGHSGVICNRADGCNRDWSAQPGRGACHRRGDGGRRSSTEHFFDSGLYAAQFHGRSGHSGADGKRKTKDLVLDSARDHCGAPAIVGTWIGGFVASPLAAIVFLAIGAEAVFQAVVTIGRF